MEIIKGKGLGKIESAQYHLLKFDSLSAIIDQAEKQDDTGTKSHRFDPEYNATKTFDEAIGLARHGWHDARERVDGHLEPLREALGTLLDTTTERAHDIIGYEPDIDRYLAGEMECMYEDFFVEAPKEGKVFRLLVDVSMTFDNSPGDILKRGAVLCALVEAYNLLGLQLEVWCEGTWKGYDSNIGYASILTKINSAGDPIDIDAMMFALGHPDYNRRLQWAVGELDSVFAQKFGYNINGYYGLCRNGSHFMEYVGASSVVSLDGNRDMTRDPLKWITGQLEAQGVWEAPE